MSTTCQLGLTRPVVHRAKPQISSMNEVARIHTCPHLLFSSFMEIWKLILKRMFIQRRIRTQSKELIRRNGVHQGGRSIRMKGKGVTWDGYEEQADLANLRLCNWIQIANHSVKRQISIFGKTGTRCIMDGHLF